MKNKPKLIYIEGNIGAGKSTLLEKLKVDLSNVADFVREPVDIWTQFVDNKGVNILEKFLNDKQRWSYTFHNFAFLTRMKLILKKLQNSQKKFIILDRSLMSDVEAFGPILHQEGHLQKFELEIYKMWNQFFLDHFDGFSNGYATIYLKVDPSVAFERINKRGRNEEKTVDKDYVVKLGKQHDGWLLNKKDTLIIDGNKDFYANTEEYELILQKISEWLAKLS